MSILGTPGNDTLVGTSGDDIFDLRQGGDDTVQGLAGNDIFTFGATFTAADSVDGGAGADQIRLNGDYSAGIVFAATTMTDVQSIALSGGFTYNLTTDDANVAAGSHLTVNGGNLTAGGALIFNGTGETDGHFILTGGGQGNDILRGGTGPDTFYIGTNAVGSGGEDRVEGRNGDDTTYAGAALDASDKIDGGTGNDTLVLDGDYTGAHALTFAPTTVENIDTLVLKGGHSYDITTNDRPLLQAIEVVATDLGPNDSLTFDGSADTVSALTLRGGQGNDDIRGSNAANNFDLSQGGNDFATGGSGNDDFFMGAALSAGDVIDGGTGGFDEVFLQGEYTGANAVTLRAGSLSHIQKLSLGGDAFDYHITVGGNMVGNGTLQVLIDADVTSVVFNASGDNSTGSYVFEPGQNSTGNLVLTGGYGDDTFNVSNATQYTLRGGHGFDIFYVGSTFTASDFIDGGGGNDLVEFAGGGVVIGTSSIFNVENYKIDNVAGSFAYHFTLTDANIPPGGQLFINGDGLNGSNSLTVDASAVTAGSVVAYGGAANDVLTGGAGNDTFSIGPGNANIVTGGGGADFIYWGNGTGTGTAIYNAVSDSTGVNHDSYNTQFDFGIDHIQIHALGALPTAIDPKIAGGALSMATFDSDLAAAVGAGQLGAGHAVLFKATSGNLSGHTILVVDENGTAGYQSGQDLVIDVSHDHGTLTTATFI